MRALLLLVSTAWVTLGIRKTLREKSSAKSSSILPLYETPTSPLRLPSTYVEHGWFWATLSTTRFNSSIRFNKGSRTAATGFLYKLAAWLGPMFMVISLGILAQQTSLLLFRSWLTQKPQHQLQKRSWHHTDSIAGEQPTSLHLILPGWTTPSAFLPSFLFAIITSAIVHEVGHAIPAALFVLLSLCNALARSCMLLFKVTNCNRRLLDWLCSTSFPALLSLSTRPISNLSMPSTDYLSGPVASPTMLFFLCPVGCYLAGAWLSWRPCNLLLFGRT